MILDTSSVPYRLELPHLSPGLDSSPIHRCYRLKSEIDREADHVERSCDRLR